jgi:hypothetical protein
MTPGREAMPAGQARYARISGKGDAMTRDGLVGVAVAVGFVLVFWAVERAQDARGRH